MLKKKKTYLVLRPTTYARVIQSREIPLPQLYQQQKNTNAKEEQYSAAWPFNSHTKTFKETSGGPHPPTLPALWNQVLTRYQHKGTPHAGVAALGTCYSSVHGQAVVTC